jgi:hypothetical protein
MPHEGRPAKVALAFAIAAALAAWNPLAAPFGLVVGVAAIVLSARALSGARGRRLALAGLVVALAAAVTSAAVLALTAGVGRRGDGDAIVKARTPEEVRQALDRAERESREARDRARRELEQLDAPR